MLQRATMRLRLFAQSGRAAERHQAPGKTGILHDANSQEYAPIHENRYTVTQVL
jgi:hypothetical protein